MCITIIVQYDLTVTSLIGTIIRAACDKRNGSQLTAITISKSHFTTCNLQNKCITAVCCDFSRLVLFVTSFVGLLVWNTFYKVWATSAKDVLSTKVSSFHYYLCCYYYFWQSSRHSPQKRVRQYCICKMAKLTYSAKSTFSPLWNVVRSVPSKKILHWAKVYFSEHAIAQPLRHTTTEAFQAVKGLCDTLYVRH